MADDYEELLNAIDVGLMADDVVIGLSRIRRGAEPAAHHRAAIGRAVDLVRPLADPELRLVSRPSSSLHRLVDFRSQAAEAAPSPTDWPDRATYFAALLEALSAAQQGHRPEAGMGLDEVLGLFDRIAHASQARADGHIASPAQPIWTDSRLIANC